MFLICQAKATEMLEQIHLYMATGLKVLAVRLTIVSVMKLTWLRIRWLSHVSTLSLLSGLQVPLLEQLL